MSRALAFAWLVLVIVAGAYLAWRAAGGLRFQTDITALLPREEQDLGLRRANDSVTDALSRQVVLLFGAADRDRARAAATDVADRLRSQGLLSLATGGLDKDRLQALGRLYFPYRGGLLSDDDRRRLQEGRGREIVNRALSQIFGFVGMADARLLKSDPFLLMPAYFSSLPIPMSRLSLDDGMMSVSQDGTTWVLVAGRLNGGPYELDVQKRLSAVVDDGSWRASHPDVELLRLGAVFYAKAGAEQAMSETSGIGLLSTAGTILLVLLVFRALSPLWLSLLVIGTGVVMALSASLWLFGEIHVGALLFGVSLIGVAVDYSLQYCAEIFGEAAPPAARLRRVRSGVTLGAATTVIGYLTLFLAPFPGLHQIAIFSAVGLAAAWATVMLWLPRLDRSRPPRHGRRWLGLGRRVAALWLEPGYRRFRLVSAIGLGLAAAIGFCRIHVDDDVRHMQALSPALKAQQERILGLIGDTAGGRFFVVEAADEEGALRREEALAEALRPLLSDGGLRGFQSLSRYVPSALRQRDNRRLRRTALDAPLLDGYLRQLGFEAFPAPREENDADAPILTPERLLSGDGPLSFLAMLHLGTRQGVVTHVVTLDGVVDPLRVAGAARGMEGVRYVDPAASFTDLLGEYRYRALWLTGLSAILMIPFLMIRHGPKGLRLLVPPLLAVVLTPGLRALAGGAFTFFDAMALVLALSVGVDYAVFCAESQGGRRPVTALAIALAASAALMSFGLLAVSGVAAVHAFGATMSLGILLAFLLAPMVWTMEPGGIPVDHWARMAERGTWLGLRVALLFYRLAGRRGCQALLWLIVPYFYLSDGRRRRCSLDFLTRVRAVRGEAAPGWRDGLAHFMSFAGKALDTVTAWANPERSGPIRLVGAEAIQRLAAEGRGGLLIVSHLGNADMCRAHLTRLFGRPVNVLLHTRHAVHYNRILNIVHPGAALQTIEVTEIGPETAIDLKGRIERGEWIAIAGDRVPVLSRTRVGRVSFLGGTAAFSQGPFILAALMDCPVQLMFCLREKDGFSVHFETFSEDGIVLPRKSREESLRELCQAYASVLEKYCLMAPLQWFNFFDFWE